MGKCESQGQKTEERRQGGAVAWAGLGCYISAGPSLVHFAAIKDNEQNFRDKEGM